MTHKVYNIKNGVTAIVLDIDEEFVQEQIAENVVSICEGNSETDLETIKIKLKDYLEPKGIRIRRGAIAEFYTHLFLKSLGYKQHCLFLNLEENSIKKGFDGYYVFNGDEWIVESKSGASTTHKSKIEEAYGDLKDKLTTKTKNNPWENAYNHAAHIAIGANKTILDRLKALSNNYVKNKHLPLTEFCLIPCGTVFNHDASTDTIKDIVYDTIKGTTNSMEYKKLCVIAISNRAYNAFLEFVGLEV